MEGLDTPVADATPIIPVEDSTPEPESTVASHAAQFDPQRSTPTRDEADPTPTQTPAKPERHRAQSQKARAEDVPRISELTRKLREAERELDRLRSTPASEPRAERQPQPAASPAPPQAQASADGFPDPEPKLEDFHGEDDPYSAWQRAIGRYDRKRERWEEQQQSRQTQAQTLSQDVQRLRAEQFNAHASRVAAFAPTKPDFAAKLQAANREIPPLLEQAIIEDDKGPEILYTLASDPVFLDEMHLLTDGKPVTESSVAILRRRLTAQLNRTQAAGTGSAAAMPRSSWTARPPNPVRTSPLTTGDDPPGDGHSLAEHAKHFSPKRR